MRSRLGTHPHLLGATDAKGMLILRNEWGRMNRPCPGEETGWGGGFIKAGHREAGGGSRSARQMAGAGRRQERGRQ